MFHVSVIAPSATIVVYGILFGGMHPQNYISDFKYSSVSCTVTYNCKNNPIILLIIILIIILMI